MPAMKMATLRPYPSYVVIGECDATAIARTWRRPRFHPRAREGRDDVGEQHLAVPALVSIHAPVKGATAK